MKRFRMTLVQKEAWTGRLFILPWLIGFIFFFAKLNVQSLIYSFNEITLGPKGILYRYVGLENYRYAFFVDPEFVKTLVTTLTSILYEVPLVTVYSFFASIMLNQKFKGRTAARVIFFLPFIVASGVVIHVLKQSGMSISATGTETVYLFQTSGFQNLLKEVGLNANIVTFFDEIFKRFFDTSWKSGIQVLLFLAGLQTVPRSYFEASSIEGATSWESFWMITFPLMMPYTLLCIVYTIIDSFTYYGNNIMGMIDKAFQGTRLHYSSALSWIYFAIIAVVLLTVVWSISRKTFYMND